MLIDKKVVVAKLLKAGYIPEYSTKRYVAFTLKGRPAWKVVYGSDSTFRN